MRATAIALPLFAVCAACSSPDDSTPDDSTAADAVVAEVSAAGETADVQLQNPREVHLADIRQMTFGGENAEAYWSPDGEELVFQTTRPGVPCDQIFRMPIDDPEALTMVSTGKGRTTCAYFTEDNERILYSSTHAIDEACPAPPDHSQGYVWPIYLGPQGADRHAGVRR
jgi:hypothetical protein